MVSWPVPLLLCHALACPHGYHDLRERWLTRIAQAQHVGPSVPLPEQYASLKLPVPTLTCDFRVRVLDAEATLMRADGR